MFFKKEKSSKLYNKININESKEELVDLIEKKNKINEKLSNIPDEIQRFRIKIPVKFSLLLKNVLILIY